MTKKTYSYPHRSSNQSGQIVMAAVLVFMTLSLVVVIGISAPIVAQVKNTSIMLESRKAVTTGEILNDDAIYRLLSGRALPSSMVLSINNSTSTATIVDTPSGAKQIIASSSSKETVRKTSMVLAQGGSAAPISYALHTGHGGFHITGGATVIGDVFANGSVIGFGGGSVTGSVSAASTLNDVIVADNTDISALYSFVDVGKVNSIQQIGQSFTVATSTPITAISFYMKKTGAPSNGTLRIFNNSGSSVGSTQIGSTGALSAASVGTSYEWVDVYPYAPITLTPGTTYWITLELQGSNSTNYYTFATNNNTYSGGALKTRTKTGSSWGSYVNPTPATQDIVFSVYIGGLTYISGNGWDTFSITGSGNAGMIDSTNAGGILYCQTGTMNNKACDTSQPLPTATTLPIGTDRITTWKTQASAGTVRNSSWTIGGGSSTSTAGALKIVGDLTVTGGSTLTINGPLYVTGTLTVSGGSRIRMAAGYGATDEFVVAGYIRLTGGGQVTGSGTSGSYAILVADNADCPSSCSGSTYAATTDGGTASMVLVAPYGTLYVTGGADLKAAMAQTIRMDGGSSLHYEAALSNITFSGSGSATWSVQSWKEIAP